MRASVKKQSAPRGNGKGPLPVASALRQYLIDIRQFPVLEREQEIELAQAAQDGQSEAFDRLIECNLRFVVKVAREYSGMGMPLEDLINEGNLGLLEAGRRFDPDRRVRFISWAVWWIRRTIRTALTTQNHVVRLPGSQLKRIHEVRATTELLRDELGREPRQDEVAQRLPVKLARLDPSLRDGIRLTHLDEPLSADRNECLADVLVDERQTSAEDSVIRDETAARVRAACEGLNDQQRAIVSARFGLATGTPMTLDEVGRSIGRSRERVRQIESLALRRLRGRYLAGSRAPVPAPVSRLDAAAS